MALFEQTNDVPIYLITGFLEAGKTSFLNFTLRQDYFMIEEPTLLISCEEGEEEYDERDLLRYNTLFEQIESQEDFTFETLRRFQRKYRPYRVILEYNPLWGMKALEEMKMPRGWGVVQQIVIVDASTFQIYQNNMKSLFVDMSRNADMVLFNRCTPDLPLASFRRSIKVVSPACDVQFADPDNRPLDIFSDSVPYNLDSDIIEIEDMDYGIFFVDARDNPDRYKGKKVRFHGRVLKSREAGADYFMPARSAMTCCAEDIQPIGYLCHSKEAPKLKEGDWIELTARVDWKYVPMAQQEEPVLQAITIKPAEEPADDLVYFN